MNDSVKIFDLSSKKIHPNPILFGIGDVFTPHQFACAEVAKQRRRDHYKITEIGNPFFHKAVDVSGLYSYLFWKKNELGDPSKVINLFETFDGRCEKFGSHNFSVHIKNQMAALTALLAWLKLYIQPRVDQIVEEDFYNSAPRKEVDIAYENALVLNPIIPTLNFFVVEQATQLIRGSIGAEISEHVKEVSHRVVKIKYDSYRYVLHLIFSNKEEWTINFHRDEFLPFWINRGVSRSGQKYLIITTETPIFEELPLHYFDGEKDKKGMPPVASSIEGFDLTRV